MSLRVFSYGGGVQSTAALVLAVQGRIDFPVFLFANVGDDSEHPVTLRYVREVAVPLAAENGIELHELHRTLRDGSAETIYGRMTRDDRKSITIPVRLQGGMPGSRSCTNDFKMRVTNKWLKEHGATRNDPAIVGLGISVDEFQRAKSTSGFDEQIVAYPLLDLRLDRARCKSIIEDAGLPVPPKSSCWFCPYKKLVEWQRMKREEPELFTRAVELEAYLRKKSIANGIGPVWMTDKLQPLDQAVGDQAVFDFDVEDTCESGYCMV